MKHHSAMNDTSHWRQIDKIIYDQSIDSGSVRDVAASDYNVGASSIQAIDLFLRLSSYLAATGKQNDILRTL